MRRIYILCICIGFATSLTNCKKNDDIFPAQIFLPVEFTVPADSVKVNPYGYTPLSASIAFNSQKEGRTFIRVHGRHGAFSDVTYLFNDFGSIHTIPVIGMYADTLNTVDIRIVNNSGDTVAQSSVVITTQSLPVDMPTSIVAGSFDETKLEKGMYLVSNFSTIGLPGRPSIPYILDDYGDIRWVLDYSGYAPLAAMFYDDGIARLRNGNFYFGDNKTSVIYEVDMLGKIINTWTMPGYSFHHEVYEETNGNFLLTATKAGSTFSDGAATTEDYIIEIDRNTKQIITAIDLKESLDEYRRAWGIGMPGDWAHGNAIFEDATDQTIVVSLRNQGVIKLDRSNNIKWILAPHKGWGTNRRGEDLNQFLLTPLDAAGNVIADTTVAYGSTITPDFEWNCYQHSPIQLPNGNMMLFDNGTNRTLDSLDGNAIYNSRPGKYSRAAEYKIDPVKMTVQQIWEYGKERDVTCYSSIISSVQFLPDSRHVIFAPGFQVPTTEVSGGKIIELDYDTKEVLNEIQISTATIFSHHRAKKISVYPNNL